MLNMMTLFVIIIIIISCRVVINSLYIVTLSVSFTSAINPNFPTQFWTIGLR